MYKRSMAIRFNGNTPTPTTILTRRGGGGAGLAGGAFHFPSFGGETLIHVISHIEVTVSLKLTLYMKTFKTLIRETISQDTENHNLQRGTHRSNRKIQTIEGDRNFLNRNETVSLYRLPSM